MSEVIELFKENNVLFVIFIVLVFMLLHGQLRFSIIKGWFKIIFVWPGLKNRDK
jgi:hypothetical protein